MTNDNFTRESNVAPNRLNKLSSSFIECLYRSLIIFEFLYESASLNRFGPSLQTHMKGSQVP